MCRPLMVGASFLAIAFHSATLFASDPSSSKYVCVFVWCVCAWYKKREKKRHTQQTCASTRKHIRELGIPVQEKKMKIMKSGHMHMPSMFFVIFFSYSSMLNLCLFMSVCLLCVDDRCFSSPNFSFFGGRCVVSLPVSDLSSRLLDKAPKEFELWMRGSGI